MYRITIKLPDGSVFSRFRIESLRFLDLCALQREYIDTWGYHVMIEKIN